MERLGRSPSQAQERLPWIKAREEHAESILRYSFYQFLFFRQWHKLREYANERGYQDHWRHSRSLSPTIARMPGRTRIVLPRRRQFANRCGGCST